MAKWRIDLLFDRFKAGWSESYFRESVSDTALYTTVNELVGIRRTLLGNSAFILGYRITPYEDVTNAPDRAKGGGAHDIPASMGVGTVPLPLDVPAVSVLARWTTLEPKVRKPVWLRGWSDASVTYGSAGNEDINDPLSNAFKVLRDYIAAGNWFCHVFDVSAAGNPGISIQSMSFDSNGYLLMVLGEAPTGMKVGDNIKLRGYAGPYGKALNGTMKVTGISGGNTIKTNRYSCENSDTSEDTPSGLVHRSKWRWVPITGGEVHHFSTHHTGRPFGLQAGRRSKKGTVHVIPADAAAIFSARAIAHASSLGWTPPRHSPSGGSSATPAQSGSRG